MYVRYDTETRRSTKKAPELLRKPLWRSSQNTSYAHYGE
jgi:hypothetical protein